LSTLGDGFLGLPTQAKNSMNGVCRFERGWVIDAALPNYRLPLI